MPYIFQNPPAGLALGQRQPMKGRVESKDEDSAAFGGQSHRRRMTDVSFWSVLRVRHGHVVQDQSRPALPAAQASIPGAKIPPWGQNTAL